MTKIVEFEKLRSDGNSTAGSGSVRRFAMSAAIPWKGWPRDMKAMMLRGSIDRPEDVQFTLSGQCPHCHNGTVFTMVTTPHIDIEHNLAGDSRTYKAWAVMTCPRCKEYILGAVHFPAGNRECWYLEHWPLDTPNTFVDPRVPRHIAADFKEALRCFAVRAYKATAVMCGRALEAACLEKGAHSTDDIGEQIDWLASAGKITEPLRRVAHTIKLASNRGAHPPDGGETESLNESEAEALIELAREVLHHVYVVPARLEALDLSKSATKVKTV